MDTRCLPFALVVLIALTLGIVALAPATADDARPKLVDHPMKDAKAGEYLRYAITNGQWKTWFIERVLAVKDGEVLWEIAKTNESGSEDKGRERIGWVKVPALKALPHQKVVEDEMVEVTIDGKALWCRRFLVDERTHPDWPEPRRSKEVWYSNDVPCSGKVKDTVSKREVTSWGQMPADEVKRRVDAYEAEQRKRAEGGN